MISFSKQQTIEHSVLANLIEVEPYKTCYVGYG